MSTIRKTFLFLLITFFVVDLSSKEALEKKSFTALERLIDEEPKNATYNYWFGASCLENQLYELAEKHLLYAAEHKVNGANQSLVDLYVATYKFTNALTCLNQLIAENKQDRSILSQLEDQKREIEDAANMLRSVEKICVIDSMVSDKTDFLEAYALSEGCGTIAFCNEFFNNVKSTHETAYLTERNERVTYAERNKKGNLDLYSRERIGHSWGDSLLLDETINTAADENYPFLMSDGTTLFYASMGKQSIGGYDIFASRYNFAEHRYVSSSNLGMPFNSVFNDFMYAIDEESQLGYFASDRFQPEGKICVYVFVPNESKELYFTDELSAQQLIKVASLQSIKETWYDDKLVKEGLRRLKKQQQQLPKHSLMEIEKERISVVINDKNSYHSIHSFKSNETKKLFENYLKQQQVLQTLEDTLLVRRIKYENSNSIQQVMLMDELFKLEKEVSDQLAKNNKLLLWVRNREIELLGKEAQ